jgi:intein/homing endonuclease
MPDKLFEITTISGRKIKATADHPFLVNKGDGKYEMVKLGELQNGDKMVIRHMVKMIPDENTTQVIINEKDVIENYRIELLELGLLNRLLPLYKIKIIAILIVSAIRIHYTPTIYSITWLIPLAVYTFGKYL